MRTADGCWVTRIAWDVVALVCCCSATGTAVLREKLTRGKGEKHTDGQRNGGEILVKKSGDFGEEGDQTRSESQIWN